MKRIVISPFSKPLRNGKKNAKNYPYWKSLIEILLSRGDKSIQVGIEGEENLNTGVFLKNLPLRDLKNLIQSCDLWISVDNFMNHLGTWVEKKGIVIFGKSDPKIFGYEQNINVLKDKKYLRDNQFYYWEEEEYNKDVFVSPETIIKIIDENF